MEQNLQFKKGKELIFLLKSGADPNKIFVWDNKETTAIILAIEESNVNNLDQYLSFIQKPIKHLNCYPIRTALKYNNYHIIKSLIRAFMIKDTLYLPFTSNIVNYHVNIFIKIISDFTAYIYFNNNYSIYTHAIKYNHLHILSSLKKANLNRYVNSNLINPLYTAIEFNNTQMINKLVNTKLDFNLNFKGNIVDYSFEKKQVNTACILLKNGYKYTNIYNLIHNVYDYSSQLLPIILKNIDKDLIMYCIDNQIMIILEKIDKQLISQYCSDNTDKMILNFIKS